MSPRDRKTEGAQRILFYAISNPYISKYHPQRNERNNFLFCLADAEYCKFVLEGILSYSIQMKTIAI